MRLTALLPTLLTLGALSSPIAVANPGEIIPHTSGVIPGKATWYCTYSYEIMFEHYVLEGHKWAVAEQELRDLIPGTVTSWEFQALDPAGPRLGFKAKVRCHRFYFSCVKGEGKRYGSLADLLCVM